MLGLDDRIAALGSDAGLALALLVALLLGLRHATDPDHLTAVATIVASDEERGSRRAGRLGLSWGLGHATTLFAFGVPVVLFGRALPGAAIQVAEVAIGVAIAALAARLLVRWRWGGARPLAGRLLAGTARHVHGPRPPLGEARPALARHLHAPPARARSPLTAFGVGLIHGVGGSAGVGILLVGALSSEATRMLALALFAGATAASMGLVSAGFAQALVLGPAGRRLEAALPLLGAVSLLFGCWYALAALGALPYGL